MWVWVGVWWGEDGNKGKTSLGQAWEIIVCICVLSGFVGVGSWRRGPTFRARNKADITEFQTFLKSDLQDGCGVFPGSSGLRLCVSRVQIPSQQIKIPHVMGRGQKKGDGCGSQQAGVGMWSTIPWSIILRYLNSSLKKVLRESFFFCLTIQVRTLKYNLVGYIDWWSHMSG